MGFARRLDRIVSDPHFRRVVMRIPLLRSVANRRSQALFDLMAGFVYSQVLFACVRLRLHDLLLERPRSFDDLSELTGLDDGPLERLLKAAAALHIVERRRGNVYGLGRTGQDLANNAAALAMIEHHAAFYHDMRDPLALLRDDRAVTQLNDYWPYAHDPADVQDRDADTYSSLMSRSLEGLAEAVLDDYPVSGRRHILDIGGGDGTFLSFASNAAGPATRLTVFDLPQVVESAARRNRYNGTNRIEFQGGNFLSDRLPDGADLVTLVRVLLDHPDESVTAILASVRRSIAPDGALLIAEPISGTSGGERVADAYFGFYLKAMGGGRTRTVAEHTSLLEKAGFRSIRFPKSRMPHLVRLIEARP